MMKMGAQMVSSRLKTVTFLVVKTAIRNQTWKPISMAAHRQFRMRTANSQFLSSII